MSALQMFLPASEPARSEALARLQRTHQLPRHLVRAPIRGAGAKRLFIGPIQVQGEQASDQPAQRDQRSGSWAQLG